MSIRESACLARFMRLCGDAWKLGWHEANGGNLSYRMDAGDIAECASSFEHGLDSAWHEFTHPVPALAGEHIMMTASGAYLQSIVCDPEHELGVIEIDSLGRGWRAAWGFEDGRRPSSEIETHIAAFDAALQANDGYDRVIYHAHCPNVIALSTVIPPDARKWTRVLWRCMTESIIVFPQGIGAVPWNVPGSDELAEATVKLMKTYTACVWMQHGLMVRAGSFDEALGTAQTIEKSAGIYLQARAACGGDEPGYLVDDEQLRAVCARYDLHPNEAFLD